MSCDGRGSEEDREANSQTLTWVKKALNSLCLANICWGIKKSRRQNVQQIRVAQSHVQGEWGLDQCWGTDTGIFCITGSFFIHFPPFFVMNGYQKCFLLGMCLEKNKKGFYGLFFFFFCWLHPVYLSVAILSSCQWLLWTIMHLIINCSPYTAL